MKTRIRSLLIAGSCAGGLAGGGWGQQGQGYVVVVPEGTGEDRSWLEVGQAVAEHREAGLVIPLRAGDAGLEAALAALETASPEYVAFVVPPDWIDDNFVGRVFEALTKFDDDPLLDCAHGFITGRTAADARRLVERTIAAEADRAAAPKRFVGVAHTFAAADLGPFATQQAAIHEAYGYETAAIIGVDDSEAWESSKREAIKQLDGASLIYCAGHGMGDWMCAIDGELLRNLTLRSGVVVNGTCHSATTLTRHDIDPRTMGIVSTPIDPQDSIALNFIAAGAIAQLGSTASSSWMNVAPAIDLFFHEGRSTGLSLMERLNDHIRQNGIEAVHVIPFVEGKPSPQFLGPDVNPGHIQSIARVVLLGDPAYTPFPERRRRIAVSLPPAQQPRQLAPARPAPPIDGARTVAQLIAALDDAAAPRFSALNQLITRGEHAVEPLIEAMKTNPNWQIPKALGAIGDERALDPLIEQLGARPPSPLREIVVEALELISGKPLGDDVDAWRAWRRESG